MKILKKLSGILLVQAFVGIWSVCVADQPTAPPTQAAQISPVNGVLYRQPVQSQIPATASAELLAIQEQLAVTRAQLQAAREFQSDMLSTVYASLGFVSGLALFLVGYNWFTNYRIYQREKETLKRELVTEFESQALAEKRRVDSELAKLRSELMSTIKESDELIASTADRKRQEGDETVRKSLLEITRLLNTRVSSVQRQLRRTSLRFNMLGKHYAEAVSDGVRLLEDALEAGVEFHVQIALQDLSTCIDNGGLFTQTEKDTLESCLNQVPEELRETADELRSKLSKIAII